MGHHTAVAESKAGGDHGVPTEPLARPQKSQRMALHYLKMPKSRQAILLLAGLFALSIVVEGMSFFFLYLGARLQLSPAFPKHYRIAQSRPRFLFSDSESPYDYDPYRLYRYKPHTQVWDCTTDRHGFLHNGLPDGFNPYEKAPGTYRIFGTFHIPVDSFQETSGGVY